MLDGNDSRISFSSGFSLIEILVVVTIIGILAMASLITYDEYLKQARDGQRIEDLKNISTALSLGMLERGGTYDCLHGIKIEPGFQTGVTAAATNCADAAEIEAVITEYFGSVPHDPLGPGDERFFYFFDGIHNCSPQPAAELLIYAQMEDEVNSNRDDVCGMVGSDPASSANNDGFYNYNTDAGRENYPYAIRIAD